MPKCKGCGQEIQWIMMASGAKMPVDAKPTKLIQVKHGIGELIDVYTPHWATCPNADQFKKKKQSKASSPSAKVWHSPVVP